MKKIILSTLLVIMAAMTCQAAAVIDEIKKIDDITAYHIPRFLIKNVLGMNDIMSEVIPGSSITALRDVESIDFIMAHKRGAMTSSCRPRRTSSATLWSMDCR